MLSELKKKSLRSIAVSPKCKEIVVLINFYILVQTVNPSCTVALIYCTHTLLQRFMLALTYASAFFFCKRIRTLTKVESGFFFFFVYIYI